MSTKLRFSECLALNLIKHTATILLIGLLTFASSNSWAQFNPGAIPPVLNLLLTDEQCSAPDLFQEVFTSNVQTNTQGIVSFNAHSAAMPLQQTVTFASTDVITDLALQLTGLTHTYVGDVNVTLKAPDGTPMTIMIDTGTDEFYDSSNFGGDYVFSDSGTSLWQATAGLAGNEIVPSASYRASENSAGGSEQANYFFTTFADGSRTAAGNWTVEFSDGYTPSDDGSLVSWTLQIITVAAEAVANPPSTFQFDGSLVVSDFSGGGSHIYLADPLENIGGIDPDLLSVELYGVIGSVYYAGGGTVDFSSGSASNYQTCADCLRLLVDFDSGNDKVFYPSGGTMTVSGDPGNDTAVITLNNVEFEEVTIDGSTFESIPVPNGNCLSADTSLLRTCAVTQVGAPYFHEDRIGSTVYPSQTFTPAIGGSEGVDEFQVRFFNAAPAAGSGYSFANSNGRFDAVIVQDFSAPTQKLFLARNGDLTINSGEPFQDQNLDATLTTMRLSELNSEQSALMANGQCIVLESPLNIMAPTPLEMEAASTTNKAMSIGTDFKGLTSGRFKGAQQQSAKQVRLGKWAGKTR